MRGKRLGFTLAEIREMLDARAHGVVGPLPVTRKKCSEQIKLLEQQRNDIGIVAETIRDLAGRGVPADDALATAEWPFPREELADAVRRGYEQLPRSQKRLPLI